MVYGFNPLTARSGATYFEKSVENQQKAFVCENPPFGGRGVRLVRIR